MQVTKRRLSKWELCLVLGMSLCLLGFSIIMSRRVSSQTAYQRYLSEPLPDGTRYTFLYPVWFNRVIQRRTQHGTTVKFLHYEPVVAQAFGIVGLPPPQDDYTFLAAYSDMIGLPEKPPGGPSWRILRTKSPFSFQSIFIHSQQGQRRYKLQHSTVPSSWERFQEWDRVIKDSLRVLPPGALSHHHKLWSYAHEPTAGAGYNEGRGK